MKAEIELWFSGDPPYQPWHAFATVEGHNTELGLGRTPWEAFFDALGDSLECPREVIV